MRKKREDAEQTRQNLLDAAFELFYENGYDRTTLDQICRHAQMTRGAGYWHFKNKQELYEQAVVDTVYRIRDMVDEKVLSRADRFSDEDILVELLWLPHSAPKDFRFFRQSIGYVQSNADFASLHQMMLEDQLIQYAYFLEPIERIKKKNQKLDKVSIQQLCFLLFYSLDDIYMRKIPSEMRVTIDKELIRQYVHLILK